MRPLVDRSRPPRAYHDHFPSTRYQYVCAPAIQIIGFVIGHHRLWISIVSPVKRRVRWLAFHGNTGGGITDIRHSEWSIRGARLSHATAAGTGKHRRSSPPSTCCRLPGGRCTANSQVKSTQVVSAGPWQDHPQAGIAGIVTPEILLLQTEVSFSSRESFFIRYAVILVDRLFTLVFQVGIGRPHQDVIAYRPPVRRSDRRHTSCDQNRPRPRYPPWPGTAVDIDIVDGSQESIYLESKSQVLVAGLLIRGQRSPIFWACWAMALVPGCILIPSLFLDNDFNIPIMCKATDLDAYSSHQQPAA